MCGTVNADERVARQVQAGERQWENDTFQALTPDPSPVDGRGEAGFLLPAVAEGLGMRGSMW